MRTRIMLVAALVAAALGGPTPASGAVRQRPVLDVSFGVDGLARGHEGNFGYGIVDMALQPDGRIVAVGGGEVPNSTNTGFNVARYLPDGTLDPSFGVNGEVAFDVSPEGYGSVPSAVVVRPDGRILIAGVAAWSAVVFALLPDGTPDDSFGTGGRSVPATGSNTFSRVFDMVLSPDGAVLITLDGPANDDGGPIALARLRTDGTLDPSFGDGGVARGAALPGKYDYATHLAVAPDGGILVSGHMGWWGSLPEISTQVLLARFKPDGAIDTSFGVNGRVIRDLSGPTGTSHVRGMAVAPDGRVVLTVGVQEFPPDERYITRAGLLRYLPDGRPDPSFGRRGFAPIEVPARSWRLTSPMIRPDGRILTVGSTDELDASHLVLAQIRPDGRPDPTFGNRGVLLPEVPGDNPQGDVVKIRPDGRLVVGGRVHDAETGYSFAVFQFRP